MFRLLKFIFWLNIKFWRKIDDLYFIWIFCINIILLLITYYCFTLVTAEGYFCTGSHTVTHTVGLLRTSDQPVTETSTWQHTTITTDRQTCTPGGIRISKPSNKMASDSRCQRCRPGWELIVHIQSINKLTTYHISEYLIKMFKYEAQTALFKDPVRTAK